MRMETRVAEPVENKVLVASALRALGNAYRMDWSNFDGRTLRSELELLADAIASPNPFNMDHWYMGENICPESNRWAEWCDQKGSSRTFCAHLDAILSPASVPGGESEPTERNES